MKFAFCNYAFGDRFIAAQIRQNELIKAQQFDEIHSLGPADLGEEFTNRHKDIDENPAAPIRNGVPFIIPMPIWKPYIMFKLLNDLEFGDILLYMDVLDDVTGNPRLKEYLIDRTNENDGFATMNLPWPNSQWTRRDSFVLMNCDTQEYWDCPQTEAGFIGLRKSMKTMEFLAAWLTYIMDPRIAASLMVNQFGDNHPNFRDHRADQSIYSLLLKRFGVQRTDAGAGMARYGLSHWMEGAASWGTNYG